MSTDSPGEFKGEVVGLKFGIVAARYNGEFVDTLLESVVENLEKEGVGPDNIAQIRVPGSNEVPYTISMMAETEDFDCLIALGVLIGGDTQHHIMVGSNTGLTLQKISVDSEIPVINGIIVVENRDQAEVRCTGAINRGREFALAALEMAVLNVSITGLLENLENNRDEFSQEKLSEGPDIWKS